MRKARITLRISTLLVFRKGGKEACEDTDEKQRDLFLFLRGRITFTLSAQ